MVFRYFYGKEADQYSFIRIPKLLLTDKDFSSLSIIICMDWILTRELTSWPILRL